MQQNKEARHYVIVELADDHFVVAELDRDSEDCANGHAVLPITQPITSELDREYTRSDALVSLRSRELDYSDYEYFMTLSCACANQHNEETTELERLQAEAAIFDQGMTTRKQLILQLCTELMPLASFREALASLTHADQSVIVQSDGQNRDIAHVECHDDGQLMIVTF